MKNLQKKIWKNFLLFIIILFSLYCNSKFKYTTKLDAEILKHIQEEAVDKVLPFMDDQVEFEYSNDATLMFSKTNDSKDFLSGRTSEYYRFLFQLDDSFKDKAWLSFKDSIIRSYKVEAENNEVNEDGTYLRTIHIYSENSYNRISLKCLDESSCKITAFLIASTR